MPAGSETDSSIGFYTVVQTQGAGLTGGYLVLNSAGRPLEFHCTLPVRPSRAQEILYGPTLEPFLIGERLIQALLAKSRMRPSLLCTDQPLEAKLADQIDMPVALVCSDASESRDGIPCGDYQLTPLGSGARHERTSAALRELASSDIDLREPLERIREAIREAQASARAA